MSTVWYLWRVATPTAVEERSRAGFGHKPALDGIRAVAVASVMAYHFDVGSARGGFLGVDMFFVLSGYLITSLLLVEWERSATLDFSAFWARRARRLLPALVLVLLAVSAWASVAAHTDQLGTIRWDSIWTLFYGANWHFIASEQSYFDIFRDPPPLRHAWSLAIEEQFYLVWPLVTFAGLALARGRRFLLGVTCVIGVGVSTVLMARWYEASDPSRSYYGTDTRAAQLLVGALLAIALLAWEPRTRGARRATQLAGFAGAAFCVWAFFGVEDRASWLYHGGFLLFAVATAAVIAASVQPDRTPLHALLTLPALRWVGAISYGLYLWHWPIAVACTEGRTGLSGWALTFVRVVLTVVAASLSYYFLELPIRQGGWLRGRVAHVVAPLAGVVTAVVIIVSTVGASPPPEFLVARPDEARARPASVPAAPLRASEAELGIARMLLLGDSVADTLSTPLQEEAARHGVALTSITRPGCGMTTAVPLRQDGTEVPWGAACARATADYQSGAIREFAPDAVLWLSTWETSDLLAGDVRAAFGTPPGDALLLAELESARERVTAAGARLVLVTVPRPADTSEVEPLRADEGDRRRHLNRLFHRFASRHPSDVAVADLASIVCPSISSCPAIVDGVVLRPRDGNHFEGDGPAWVAPRLYAEIVRSLRALQPHPTPEVLVPGIG